METRPSKQSLPCHKTTRSYNVTQHHNTYLYRPILEFLNWEDKTSNCTEIQSAVACATGFQNKCQIVKTGIMSRLLPKIYDINKVSGSMAW